MLELDAKTVQHIVSTTYQVDSASQKLWTVSVTVLVLFHAEPETRRGSKNRTQK